MTSAAPMVELDARIGEVLAAAANLPPAVLGAFRERVYDLLSHHRSSVLKHHRLPGGRRAQKWLATRLYRFTRAPERPGHAADVYGEGFAAAVSGETFGPDALRRVEFGGTVTSRALMAIPTGLGAARRKQFARLLESGALSVTPTGALVRERAGRARDARGARSELWGVLRRSRRQAPALGYEAQFRSVQARHLPKFEADLGRAVTAAGRAALAERARDRGLRRGAYLAALRAYLDQNPRKYAEARRWAAAAARGVSERSA